MNRFAHLLHVAPTPLLLFALSGEKMMASLPHWFDCKCTYLRHFDQNLSTNLREFADPVKKVQQIFPELTENGMVHGSQDRAA